MTSFDRGSTVPLILGFVVLAMVACAGAVAAGQAFVSQRDVQDRCDAIAASAAASAGAVDRGRPVGTETALRFSDVTQAVAAAVDREPFGRTFHVDARLTDQGRTIRLLCSAIIPVAFGAVFGRPHGLHHVVDSSAREPISP